MLRRTSAAFNITEAVIRGGNILLYARRWRLTLFLVTNLGQHVTRSGHEIVIVCQSGFVQVGNRDQS
jgi:hypothetical protein